MVDFEYRIILRYRRKTLSIRVLPDNSVVVAAPLGASREKIAEVVERNADWVRRIIRKNDEDRRARTEDRFQTGGKFLYLGKGFLLRVETAPHADVTLADGTIRVRTPSTDDASRHAGVRAALMRWYIARAREEIQRRLPVFSARIGATPRAVTIKSMRSRWGSCSPLGNISLAWNIVMAPGEIVDYLIVHELCHMVHPNHSSAFWSFVRSFLPDCDSRRKWLRRNGNLLHF